MREHLHRWCTVVIMSDSGEFTYSGRLLEVGESFLLFKSKDGRLKSVRIADIRELSSEEVRS